MRDYPDPREYIAEHIRQSMEKYANGLKESGLQPNEKLAKAIIERAIDEAGRNYEQEIDEILVRNIGLIDQKYQSGKKKIISNRDRQINKIRRQRARRERMKVCLPIVITSILTAAYQFSHHGSFVGICFSVNALVFLIMIMI